MLGGTITTIIKAMMKGVIARRGDAGNKSETKVDHFEKCIKSHFLFKPFFFFQTKTKKIYLFLLIFYST
jgi:hypothetical protein